MKPFETMTEYDVINYAYLFVLDMLLEAGDRLAQNPENKIAKARYDDLDKKHNELRDRLIELEKAGHN